MKTFKRRKYGSEIWKIIAKFVCLPRFIAMVRQFQDGMQARVQNDGEFSEPFEVTNGVKQVCVMAPTLFSMMCSAMLMEKVQVGKDQENAQSEKDSHSKNQGGKKPN